jgi:hypothetical protein
MTDFIRVEGEACPPGYRYATYIEVMENLSAACSTLQQWDIARLGNGASMDGSGYDCKVRSEDDRTLGNALCVRL